MRKYKTLPVLRHKILKVYGLSEPSIAEMLKQVPKKIKNIMLGFYPNFPENHVTISLRGQDEPTVMDALNRTVNEIRSILGPFLLPSEGLLSNLFPPNTFEYLQEVGLSNLF